MVEQKKPLNIRDIAKAAGVSQATVSRALNLSPETTPSARQQSILELCARLHYEPNEHFRRIYSRRSNTVALIFSELAKDSPEQGGFERYADLNLSACIRGAQEFFAEREIDLLLLEATPAFLNSKRYLKMIRGQLLDGALLWGMIDENDWIRDFQSENFPVVMIQTETDILDCPRVIADDYASMSALVEEAIAAGHRNFAFFGLNPTFSIAQQRTAAVFDTLAKHGLKPAYSTHRLHETFSSTRKSVCEMMEKTSQTTCVITLFPIVAYAVLTELQERKFRIPEDITILSADCVSLPGMSANIFSYLSDYKQVGRVGAELLLRQTCGKDTPHRLRIPSFPLPEKLRLQALYSPSDENNRTRRMKVESNRMELRKFSLSAPGRKGACGSECQENHRTTEGSSIKRERQK